MATLLYRCPAGLSGDMNLGAMVALGACPKTLEAELRKLPYEGWSLRFEEDIRSGISGLRCDVILEDTHTHHHHDHEHSHSHSHSTSGEDSHSHGHSHHRTFKEIRQAIESSTLSTRVKIDAIACFRVLAEAEGSVHGIDPESVHFHEVGAIDSIIDMVGAAICWELLDVDRIVCSTLEVGGGTVRCAHGIMPVPAPATAQILTGVPLTAGGSDKETTTPTGAALLVGKACQFGKSIDGCLLRSARGIGQRQDPKIANAVYVSLFNEEHPKEFEHDSVIELAVNLDDMTGEAIGFLLSQLEKSPALEVWQTDARFKKNRPATIIHALVDADQANHVENLFFKHSSTLGVRRTTWQRHKLPREQIEFASSLGTVRIKQATLPDGSTRCKVEYEDCARIAEETDQAIERIQQRILNEFLKA
ncbi:MAG: nickel pincer cofactor biosynthesis protein LarC [Coraliomargaritaceae bacterium]